MPETRAARIARAIVLALIALFVLFPLYTVAVSSIKPTSDVQSAWRWLPTSVTLEPYLDMWRTVPLARYFLNSLIVAGVATIVAVVVSTMAAYAVSRMSFRGRSLFTNTALATQLFPGIMFLVPLYLLFANVERLTGFDLIGSYPGLIIAYLTFALPFCTWMLAGFISSVPEELEEAGQIDGLSRVGTLLRIVMPVIVPGLLATGTFAFMIAWGEVLFASVLTTNSSRTLGVGLQDYATSTGVAWNQVMAASIVISIPVVLAFLAMQKYLVRGLAAGAVKG